MKKEEEEKKKEESYYSLQASDVAQLLAKVATGCYLLRAVDDVKFWLLRVQSTLLQHQ